MDPNPSTPPSVAQSYVDGVRELFTPSGLPTGERGGHGPTSYTDLADQAERLAQLSDELTGTTAAQLTASDADLRSQAEAQLLAKALTDLEVSTYLLQCAMDEEDDLHWSQEVSGERSSVSRGATETPLRYLLGEFQPGAVAVERSAIDLRDLPTARVMLTTAVEESLALISERASKTGQVALSGLVGLGLTEVAQAAGIVGLDIARVLGKAEQLTRLYNLFREFALKAYGNLVALLGQQLAQTAAQQVLEWVEKFNEGEQLGKLLEKLYETQLTGQELARMVADSPADLEKVSAAIQIVEGLEGAFRQKITLAEDLLKKLKFVGSLPATVIPQGRLLLAAVYLVLGGYVILSGADYVDARKLRLLDRVPGVRQVVITSLLAT